MKILSNLGNTWDLFWYKRRRNRLLKVKDKHLSAIFLISYIQANSLFPDVMLHENFKLSALVCHGFLGTLTATKIEEAKDEPVERLRENLSYNERMIDALLNYFLLESLCCAFENKDGHNTILKEKEDEAFNKALLYKATVEPISIQDVKNIDKKIKKELKGLKKEKAKIKSKKIADERLKAIDPITIDASAVFLFASLVSSVFLVGGFLRANILLWYFGINTSDFFDISDYLSSSVDVIVPTLIFAVVGMLCYFGSESRDLSSAIDTKQFNVKTKNWRPWIRVIAGILGIIFFVIFIYYEIFLPIFLVLSIYLFCNYITFSLIKIDKYIVNKFTFRAAVLLISIFMVYLSINILNTLFEVETGSYQNPYIVSFQDEYEKYSEHEFFLANSKYVFLLDKETEEVVVIPKTGIKLIRDKKNHETHIPYLDVARQWVQKFLQILSNLQQSIAEIFTLESILNFFVSK